MTLTTDLALRQQSEFECDCCNAAIERCWNWVFRDGEKHAVYFASNYHHTNQPHDTWIDVVFGSFTDDYADHVTFGCRVGPVVNSPQPAATLVQAVMDRPPAQLHGRALSREEGLAHPRLPEFWQVVDFVLEHDPTVNQHLYGAHG